MSTMAIPESITRLVEEIELEETELAMDSGGFAKVYVDTGAEFTLSEDDCTKLFQNKKSAKAFIQALKEADLDPESCSLELNGIEPELGVYELLEDALQSVD